jgi:hypothetical protein
MGSVEARALQAILLTGQRPGEVLRMRAEHVKDDVWCMPGASDPAAGWLGAKNSRNHRVPLPPPVLDAINGSKSGFVFDPKGRLDVAMKKACATAGIADRVTPHDCRRTFGTLVTRLGFGRAAMDRLLNHADHSVGSIYDRYNYASEDRQIMEAVAAHFLRLVAPWSGGSSLLPSASRRLRTPRPSRPTPPTGDSFEHYHADEGEVDLPPGSWCLVLSVRNNHGEPHTLVYRRGTFDWCDPEDRVVVNNKNWVNRNVRRSYADEDRAIVQKISAHVLALNQTALDSMRADA